MQKVASDLAGEKAQETNWNAKHRLTKKLIDSLTPRDKDYIVWDGEIPGFGIRVNPKGKRSFFVQYRNMARRTRKLTLGSFGRLTPDQARTLALQHLADVTKGADPSQERSDHRQGITIADLAERYLSAHAEPKKKVSSVRDDKRLLSKIILPVLGSKRIDAITREDAARLHHKLRATPYQANRVLSLLSKMFNLAEAWGLRPDGSNPCRHVQRFKEGKRERYLSREELARLGEVLRKVGPEGSEWPAVITAIRLLIFTGARLGEILNLRWDEVDIEAGLSRLSDSKTGRKDIMLGAAAVETLEGAFRVQGNPYVCPGTKEGRSLVGIQHAWERIRKAAGLEDVRLHDLRHTYASVGAGAGMGLPVIGALLGHTQPQTTARYAHLASDPLRRAAEQISTTIDEAMKQPVPKGRVIPIK